MTPRHLTTEPATTDGPPRRAARGPPPPAIPTHRSSAPRTPTVARMRRCPVRSHVARTERGIDPNPTQYVAAVATRVTLPVQSCEPPVVLVLHVALGRPAHHHAAPPRSRPGGAGGDVEPLARRLSVADPNRTCRSPRPPARSRRPRRAAPPCGPATLVGNRNRRRYTPVRLASGTRGGGPGKGMRMFVYCGRSQPCTASTRERRSRPSRGRRVPAATSASTSSSGRPARRKRHDPSRSRIHGDAPVYADTSSG